MSASGIRAGRAFVEIGANSAPLQAALARIRGKINAFGSGLAKVAGGVAAAGLGVGAALAWPVTLASNLEQATVKFTTMLGSADAAAKMLKDIRAMAAATPFETSDLIGAAETLMQFGVSAEEILPMLQRLGDASGGNAERFQSLALVFGQVAANGRLMGGDVLQMVNAGFNPLMEIANRTGESMVDLRKRMEDGGIGVDEVKQAFTDATGPAGKFFDLIDKHSKALASESLKSFGVAANDIEPTLRALADASGGNVAQFQALAHVFGKVAQDGKLMAGDLSIMAASGFDPLAAIAKRTGESSEELKARMEAGGVGIDEVKQAFTDAMSPAGRFFGLMDEQSKTLAGRFSTLKDAIAEALLPLGEYLVPMLKTSVAAATAAIQNIGSAWEIGLALIDLRWAQLSGGMVEWTNAFKDVWTDASTWIAQVGVTAFSGLGSAWDAVMTSIASGADWIWAKLKQLLELMQMAGEKIGILETSQADQGKTVGDRLGAIEEERRARAKAREEEYNARAADRLRDKTNTHKMLKEMADTEKRNRALSINQQIKDSEAKLKSAQDRFNQLIGEGDDKQKKRQELLKKSGENAMAKASGSTNILGQFNASLASQQVGFKASQDRIAKATEASLMQLKSIDGKIDGAGGIVVT